jgi:alpha-beta hydrolase superfamily lysophospholipase
MPINARFAVARRALLGSAALAGCGARVAGRGGAVAEPLATDDALVMEDGYRLPLRTWLPDGQPRGAILALHGFNDHAGAWDIPAPLLTAQGFIVHAYDQRGFGATATRGLWPGVDALVADCISATRLVTGRAGGLPLALLGESMGAAVLIAAGSAPPAQAWLLLAPAVWGRATMNPIARGALSFFSQVLPSMAVSGANPVTRVTDDEAVLAAMARDRLLIRQTRMDAVAGVVDMMDAARAAAPSFDPGPTLVLWAGRDDLIPGGATQSFLASLPPAPPAVREVRFEPGGYHLLLRDTMRGARATTIGAFLQQHLPAPVVSR